jgi:hypothetical protein
LVNPSTCMASIIVNILREPLAENHQRSDDSVYTSDSILSLSGQSGTVRAMITSTG